MVELLVLFGACKISECSNFGLISGANRLIGGIIGDCETDNIVENCVNYGTVMGDSPTSYHVGGIAGRIGGVKVEFRGCFSLGSVSAYNGAGGILGGAPFENAYAVIESCYNSGTITTTHDYAGGIIGMSAGKVEIINCYNVGTASSGTSRQGSVVGGLTSAATYLSVTQTYYPDVMPTTIGWIHSSATGVSIDATPYLDSFMKSQGFVDVLNAGLDTDIWTMDDGKNSGYPIFIWQ